MCKSIPKLPKMIDNGSVVEAPIQIWKAILPLKEHQKNDKHGLERKEGVGDVQTLFFREPFTLRQ